MPMERGGFHVADNFTFGRARKMGNDRKSIPEVDNADKQLVKSIKSLL